MVNILTVPKKLTGKRDLVIMPRSEYKKVLEVSRRLLLEEKDTDEAIRIFEKERKARKLKKVSGFSEILGIQKFRK